MKKKRYDGYRSFQYLTPGKDYRPFVLANEGNCFPACEVRLNREEAERVREIFNGQTVVSLRDHGFIVPDDPRDIIDYCRQPHTSYAYKGLSESGLDLIFENFMDGIAILSSRNGLKWDDVITTLGIRFCDLAQQEMIDLVRNFEDVKKAHETGKIGLLASLEAATALENEVDRVDMLYGFGIRCMGITYNDANTLGSGLTEKTDAGLTNFGRKVVKRMNRLGMVIDISHCGDRTSLDVIRCSEKPVFITHAGARSVWDSPRMKSDEVLKACAQRGGIIGILAAPNTTMSPRQPEHNLDAVMEHFEYIVDLVGIDHVGFGPDTFYGDHVALQHAFDSMLSLSESHGGDNHEESQYVKGLENPTEAMKNIVSWLVKHHYSDTEIKKVVGGNALRVLREIL